MSLHETYQGVSDIEEQEYFNNVISISDEVSYLWDSEAPCNCSIQH